MLFLYKTGLANACVGVFWGPVADRWPLDGLLSHPQPGQRGMGWWRGRMGDRTQTGVSSRDNIKSAIQTLVTLPGLHSYSTSCRPFGDMYIILFCHSSLRSHLIHSSLYPKHNPGTSLTLAKYSICDTVMNAGMNTHLDVIQNF